MIVPAGTLMDSSALSSIAAIVSAALWLSALCACLNDFRVYTAGSLVVSSLFVFCTLKFLTRDNEAYQQKSYPHESSSPATSSMFVHKHAHYVIDAELEWWREVLGRIFEVDFTPDAPSSVPRPALLELGSWLQEVHAEQLQGRRADAVGMHDPIDDIWASRALIATDFDVNEAVRIVNSYVNWRRQHPGLTVPLQAWLDYAIVIVPFEDKWGRPVAISRLRSYHTGLPLSVMTNGYRATADGVIAHLLMRRENVPSHKNPLEQWILCIDCEGIGWGNFSMEYIQMFVRESKERYMERIAAIYLLTPPTYWRVMWNMMRPFLHPRTLRKIQLVPSAKVPLVMRDLMGTRADDLLWPSYGGLAPPYPPPGKGRTLEDKVGALLANTWKELGVVESDGKGIEKQVINGHRDIGCSQTWLNSLTCCLCGRN